MPLHRRVALALVAFGLGGFLGPAPSPDPLAQRYALAVTHNDNLLLTPLGLGVPDSPRRTLACSALVSFGTLDVGMRCAAVPRRSMSLATAD